MKIIAWDKVTDKAVEPEREPVTGEWCYTDDGKRKVKKQYHPNPDVPTATIEREWCEGEINRLNSELLTGDNLDILFAYIVELREYLKIAKFKSRPILE